MGGLAKKEHPKIGMGATIEGRWKRRLEGQAKREGKTTSCYVGELLTMIAMQLPDEGWVDPNQGKLDLT